MRMSVALLLLLAGCNSGKKDAPPPTPAPTPTPVATTSTAPSPLRGRPRTQAELATTAGDIYVTNLESQVEAAERVIKYDPKEPHKIAAIGATHYARGKFRGDLDEIAAAIEMTSKAIAIAPNDAKRYLARANQEQTLHRFAKAQADVDEAKKRGASADEIADVQQELDWNAGKYDAAIAAIHAARKRAPGIYTIAREAQLAHDLGDADTAEHLFEEAEDSFKDTSPLPIAWLNVQRGMHLVALGRTEQALLFFREAVARIPSYVMAEEHLAETLHQTGADDEAQKIYEHILETSKDPEFMGQLASIHRAHGRVKEADALKAKATARYGELLAKYPEAMYWHASEYFMEEGADPKQALALLTKNLELRPNATSYIALARAQLANGDTPSAKASIDKALASPIKSAVLFWTAARAYKKSGDETRANDYAARAKALNPNIAKTEPAL